MAAVELFMGGADTGFICERLGYEKLPAALETYFICCPSMDLNLRFLPREGGYYNQFYTDMKWFRVIERQVISHLNRKAQEKPHGVRT